MNYNWHGVEAKVKAEDWKKFKKFHYSVSPLYQEEFLASWKRKRNKKGHRLTKAERAACEQFLERLEKEGDGFATRCVFIQKIDKRIGCGLFARKKIPKGTVIGVYSGRAIRSKGESASRFLFYFSKMKDWDIDAQKMRNYTAFMNHAKSRSSACNVKTIEFYCEEPKILFIAMKEIEKGSQLCYDYGDDYWDPLEEPDAFKGISQKKRF